MNELPKPDSVLKDYFDDWHHFCDFINGAVFNGNDVICYDDVLPYESETTTIVDFGDDISSIQGIRDVVVKTCMKGVFVIVALENQGKKDVWMALRELIYTGAEYNKQYRKYQSEARKSKVSGPFILIPVITPVFYYGKDNWKEKINLLDNVKMAEEYRDFINNWKIRIYDIKKLDVKKFKDSDNIAFIDTVQKIHRCKSYEELKGIKLKREVALAVAIVTDEKNFKKYVEEKKEEELDMYESMERFYNQSIETGKKLGRKEGKRDGILKTIIIILNNKIGKLSEDVIKKIESCTIGQLNELTNEIINFQNEEEVRNYLMQL